MNKEKKLEVLELCSGIRASTQALKNLNIDHNTTSVEFDSKIQEVANHLHGTNDPTRDITKFVVDKKYNLVIAGFPCQPFSQAGIGLGFEDSRGKIYLEVLRIIKQADPEYVVLENVKAITYQKHKWIIEDIEKKLTEMGYMIHTQIINAKNYIPQNRERVFIMASKIKIPKEITKKTHNYILKDFLEKDEKIALNYYITNKQINNLKLDIEKLEIKDSKKIIKVGNCSKSNHNGLNIYYVEGISPTFRDNNGASIKIIYSNKEFYSKEKLEKMLNLMSENLIVFTKKYMYSNKDGIDRQGDRIFYDFIENINTLPSSCGIYKVLENSINIEKYIKETPKIEIKKNEVFALLETFKIRSLTPRESFKLMGWNDICIDKVINLPKSKGTLYKAAGNSMVIQVMEDILKNLLN